MDPLSDAEITKRLAGLPGWEHDGSQIRLTFEFIDF